jgi:diaminopimelate decarboxylase
MNNYNAMPRPASVLVSGNKSSIIRRAEREEDIFKRDVMPEHLQKKVV